MVTAPPPGARPVGCFFSARCPLAETLCFEIFPAETDLGSGHRVRCHRARLLLAAGVASEALALGESALAAHEKILGRDHPWTADSARVAAEAREALGRRFGSGGGS